MNDYKLIVQHYENCLKRFGDTCKGVDWPNEEGALLRYKIMLGLLKRAPDKTVSILDFGCGTGGLLDYIRSKKIAHIQYTGLDLSREFIAVCRNKFPDDNFICFDILNDEKSLITDVLPQYDYVILNGVFTEKLSLSHNEMWGYFERVIKLLWPVVNKGMAFNLMSKAVDWEREDLFHVSFDQLADFLRAHLSGNFSFRQDYGLFEYTTYIYT